MMENLKIREFELGDQSILLEILKLNTPKYFALSEINDFKKYLQHKIEIYFVVEINGNIIGGGGINYEDNKRVGKLSWDLIHPNYHGQGVGTLLLNHRLQLLKSIETITVRTSQLAYKFYEKNGFIVNGIEKDYWAEGFDLYTMDLQQ